MDIESLENLKSGKEKFVLAIMIEITHENFNHLKSRYEDNYSESPLLNQIGLKNVLLCPNEFLPESGYLFEQLLIDNPIELIAIRTPNKELFKLTESKYWVQRSFANFKEIIRKYLSENKITYFKSSNEDDDSCYDKRPSIKDRLRHHCVF